MPETACVHPLCFVRHGPLTSSIWESLWWGLPSERLCGDVPGQKLQGTAQALQTSMMRAVEKSLVVADISALVMSHMACRNLNVLRFSIFAARLGR